MAPTPTTTLMMMTTTKTMTPAIAPHIAYFFASSAACCASAVRPCAHRPDTWVAFTIDTIPSGRQHNTVTKMPKIRLLFG